MNYEDISQIPSAGWSPHSSDHSSGLMRIWAQVSLKLRCLNAGVYMEKSTLLLDIHSYLTVSCFPVRRISGTQRTIQLGSHKGHHVVAYPVGTLCHLRCAMISKTCTRGLQIRCRTPHWNEGKTLISAVAPGGQVRNRRGSWMAQHACV